MGVRRDEVTARDRTRRWLAACVALALVAVAGWVAARPSAHLVATVPTVSTPRAAAPSLVAPPAPAIPPGPGQLVVRIRHATYLSARPAAPSVALLLPRTEMGSPRVLPVVERRGSWLGVLAEERPNGRVGWIHLDTNVKPARIRSAVQVSLGRRTVTVRRLARVVDLVRVAVGAPATPTPTGRFAVTDRIVSSAPSIYGCCILALSGHQPYLEPGWTGGNRIAIHSTLETSAIGTAVSHGCVRVDEAGMRRLMATVPLGTVVTIRR